MQIKKTHKKPLIIEPVVVIGAGWSGLACAVTLVQQGYKVCLLESAREPGGRARSVHLKGLLANQAPEHQRVDNGQHIMLGAYHYTQNLFKALGLKEAEILQRLPLELPMLSPENTSIHLKTLPLPAPLHLLFALLTLKGFSLVERFKTLQMALRLSLSRYKLKQDISVLNLLTGHQQTPKIITALWEPLCLATMNTPIHYASGQVFLNVIKDSFSRKRRDSDLIFFRFDLSHIFCTPAVQFIKRNNSQVQCANKVTELQIKKSLENNSLAHFFVKSNQGSYQSQVVVLATPAHITDKLLHTSANQACYEKQSFLKPQNASLKYCYEPICTIYMQYPTHIRLPKRMIGLFNTTGQWAIDRSLNKQPGLIAVVISGPGKHTTMSHSQLADTIHKELALVIANLPALLEYRIITEKRATLSCRVNIERQRPTNNTLIPGLYLAGDYTDTGYPSTLEGAIKSGVMAAKQIIKTHSDFTLKEKIAKI